MKVLKASVVSVFVALLAFGLIALHAQESRRSQRRLSPADKELFRKVKVIRVVVEQTYEKADKVRLPFYEYAEKFLEYAGFQTVKGDAKTYDATLHIKARGIAGGANYSPSGLPGLGGGSWHWTSARVSGTISLSVSNKTFKWNFSGEEWPAASIVRREPHYVSLSTPYDAPFKPAFNKGFAILLLRLVAETKDISSLVAVLKDEDLEVRYTAAKALAEINPEWMRTAEAKRKVPEFISALKDENWDLRWAAARALGKLKDPRAVEPLISALKDHWWAPLIPFLKDEDSWVRSTAAKALAKITGKNFGEDQAKWQSWWQENKGRLLK